MKAIHFPDYSHANPYQILYFEALKKQGVEIFGLKEQEALKIRKYVHEINPSIVHIHWIHPYIRGKNFFYIIGNSIKFLWSMYILRRKKIKLFWTIHNLFDHESGHHWFEKIVRKSLSHIVNKIFPLSKTAESLVHKKYGNITREKTTVIPHGNYIGYYPDEVTKEIARSKLSITSKSIVFVFLGMIRPYKGLEHLIQTAHRLQGDFNLIIAGKPLDKSYSLGINNLKAGDERIIIHDHFIPDEDLQLYLRVADWAVFPFKSVLSSGSVILAMSFGLPVVVPFLGALPEIVPEGGAIYDALQNALSINDTDILGKTNFEIMEKT